MWEHPATRRNVETLQGFGYHFVGPVHGRLASGQEGWGRMAEPEEILAAAKGLLRESSG
jgi:phosphopantothenoylcysteine decarboxylase/phosphopantothenate--cysteine ligase